jgi:hypothetical protein
MPKAFTFSQPEPDKIPPAYFTKTSKDEQQYRFCNQHERIPPALLDFMVSPLLFSLVRNTTDISKASPALRVV